jgi:putative ABC transport system substrate-binding protein
MAELRWAEGRDFVIDARFADGVPQAGATLADELVASAPDVVLTPAEGSARFLRQRTKTIPVVLAYASDPVGGGFAASLRQPGGNVTGLTSMATELWPKRMQLLKEAFPAVAHVGMMFGPGMENSVAQAKGIEAAAAGLGLRLTALELRQAADIEPALKGAASRGAQACLVTFDAISHGQRQVIADHLVRLKLPAMFANGQSVDVGGLMSYAASISDNFRRAAEYADRILKGAKPGNLSIEQPTRFELVVNIKTAKAIGATIAPSFLVRADRVVE